MKTVPICHFFETNICAISHFWFTSTCVLVYVITFGCIFSISQIGRQGSRIAMADVDIQIATIILTIVRSVKRVHGEELVSDDDVTYDIVNTFQQYDIEI